MTESELDTSSDVVTRQVVFLIKQNNLSYTFDVNHIITFHYLKRMISAAAHLPKNSFRIYNNGIDYTDHDEKTLDQFFPHEKSIPFNLLIIQQESDYDDMIKVYLDKCCDVHSNKFLFYYCYNCKTSICSLCKEEDKHKNHQVKEKYDYLQPCQTLLDDVFKRVGMKHKEDYEEDNQAQINCAKKLKRDLDSLYFPQLHKMLTEIHNNCDEKIDAYLNQLKKEKETLEINQMKVKNYCVESLKSVKREINIKRIIIDDEVFCTFEKKLNEMEIYPEQMQKDECLINKLHSFITPVKKLCEKVYEDLSNAMIDQEDTIDNDQTIEAMNKERIKLITKEEVVKKSLEDIAPKTVTPYKVPGQMKVEGLSKDIQVKISSIKTDNKPNNIDYDMDYEGNANNSFLSEKAFSTNRKYHNNLHSFNSSLTDSYKKSPYQYSKDKDCSFKSNNGIIIHKKVMKPIPNTQNIVIYTLNESSAIRRLAIFPLILPFNNFLEQSAYCNYDNNLYISGGFLNNSPSSIFIKYDSTHPTLIQMPRMNSLRYDHTLIGHDNYIYAVGGYKCRKVERYSLESLEWKDMKPMLKERQRPMLWFYDVFLYVFGGYTNDNDHEKKYETSIERINITNSNAKWDVVNYTGIPMHLTGSCLIQRREVLIFVGGIWDNVIIAENHEFNFAKNTFSKGDNHFIDTPSYYIDNTMHSELNTGVYCNIEEGGNNPSILELVQ